MTHPPADTAPTAGDVLVVDDEEPLARVVASYLEAADFSVRLAHTGPDAVAMVAQDPDDVILDLGLHGLDGVEVCRQIWTRSDCYILIFTPRMAASDKLSGHSGGAYATLT